jgi:hypothetical protein
MFHSPLSRPEAAGLSLDVLACAAMPQRAEGSHGTYWIDAKRKESQISDPG